jgi:tetratricopeptide (TPR) repeat protein
MMERRASQENPVDLIDSGQFLTAEEIFSERRTDDPMEMVVRSEVAIYFDRLEDGATLLDQVSGRIEDLDVAARFSLAKGRLALWLRDYELARVQLQTAYHFYLFLNDPFGLSHALLELARLSRENGNYDDAEAKLVEAQEKVKGRVSKRSEFLRGMIASERAALFVDRGEIDHGAESYTEATRLLKGIERGRCYARALVGIADLKCAVGEFQESLDLYKEANTGFERYDVRRDLAESQIKMAEALLRQRKYERAEKLAEESRSLSRDDPAGQSRALAFLAVLALQNPDSGEAATLAQNAIEAADRSGSSEAIVRARIAAGQVKLAQHEFKEATELLAEAAELARSKGSAAALRLELEAVIYLAEAYHNFDTRAGRAELVRASEVLNRIEDAWLGDEFNRVSGKYEEQIVFTDDNRLVFDGNQLPRWQEAKRTLEGFLLRNALRQTNNSLTRAARKLGVSKVHVHNLKKKHNV